MLDHPTNPLLSPFSPSFLTAYRSASLVIKFTKEHFERNAEIGMRIWFLLNHTFSAAVSFDRFHVNRIVYNYGGRLLSVLL